jgi:hypothetical protein
LTSQRKKLTASFIFFILVFTLFNQVIYHDVVAQQNTDVDESEEPKIGPLGNFFKFFGKLSTGLVPIFRLSVVAVAANPSYIEIGYNETKIVQVGLWDVEKDTDFEVWSDEHPIFDYRFINFMVLEYPGGTSESSWEILPDPYTVTVEVGSKLKTNLSITLTKPPISGKPIQSGILKVRVLDTWGYGNLYFPPKGSPQDTFPSKYLWFLSATVLMKFGKYSGTVDVEYKDLDILVKIKPYHAVRFDTSPVVYIKPDQITSIPISVQNLGNYNDTFGFRIKSGNKDLKLASPYYITLSPGEVQQTYLGVSAPQSAFDYGTLRELVIETYSIDDENVVIAERQVFLETKGIYVSEMGGMGLFLLIIVFFLIIAYIVYRKRLRISQFCSKPDKPWEIPEEKAYLDKLIKEDKNKYKEVLKMMEDEYESSLLWYNDYCKNLTEPKRTKNKKEKPKKEDTKSILTKEESSIKKMPKQKPDDEPIIKETKDVKIEKKEEAEDLRKQRAISKIKKKEEKQKRKLLGKT